MQPISILAVHDFCVFKDLKFRIGALEKQETQRIKSPVGPTFLNASQIIDYRKCWAYTLSLYDFIWTSNQWPLPLVKLTFQSIRVCLIAWTNFLAHSKKSKIVCNSFFNHTRIGRLLLVFTPCFCEFYGNQHVWVLSDYRFHCADSNITST